MQDTLIQNLLLTLVNNVLPEETDAIKQDVINQLTVSFVNDESKQQLDAVVQGIQVLSQRYKLIPRDKLNMIGYLTDVLDIPRLDHIEYNDTLLADILPTLGDKSVAVLNISPEEKTKLDLFNTPNGGIANEVDGVLYTTLYIRFDAETVVVFICSDESLTVVSLDLVDTTIVLKKLKDYDINSLLKQLEGISDEAYAVKRMEDRELVSLEHLDHDDILRYLEENRETIFALPELTAQAIVQLIVNKYALDNEISLENKRVSLPNSRMLMAVIDDFMTKNLTPQPEETNLAQEEVLGTPEMIPGETPNYVSEEAIHVETPVANNGEHVQGVVYTATNEIIDELKSQPVEILDILRRYDGAYQDAILSYVTSNLLPHRLQRVEPLTSEELDQVNDIVTSRVKELFTVAEEERQKARQTYEQMRNKFTKEEVLQIFNAHSSHVEFTKELGVSPSYLAEKISEYFNDNNVDMSHTDTRENTIINMLNVLALYDYNVEAIASEDFRRSNVPTSDNIIFDTKFFKTLIKKNFQRVGIEDDDLAINLAKQLQDTTSLLDLTKETVSTLSNLISEKHYTRLNSMYVIRGFNTTKTVENGVIPYATIAVLESGKAEILYVNLTEYTVDSSVVVSSVVDRMNLVDFLDV